MKKIILYLLLSLSITASSQTGNMVFNDTIMHTLVIQTTYPNWFDTLEADYNLNVSNPTLHPQKYFKCNITWDGLLLPSCGFREKGNASNSLINFGKKKPLKISFNEYSNQTLDGLKKININNFTNDPSLLHDVMANKLFRDEGIIAPRTSYTKVWVNGEYIGLYVVIENVDKTFLKIAYGSSQNDGNLYKTGRGAAVHLDWLGEALDGYKAAGLQLTTNDTIDDWSKLIAFIYFINNDYSSDFKQELEAKFDVHTYLKVLAIEKCIRSWDSYWGGGNNFFLYEHPDGQIRWIPWDENETFQDVKAISGTSLLDGYLIPANKFDKRPLLKRIFEVPEWKNEYLDDVCEVIHNKFTLANLGNYTYDRHNLIDSAYKYDTYKYNSYESFENSLTEDNADEVSLSQSASVLRIHYPGIYPFIQSQREWAVKQMKGWDYECSIEDNTIYNLFIYPNPAHDYVNISNSFTSFEYAQFKIYDFSGRLIMNTKYDIMPGNFYTLHLEGIPSGIYLLMKYSADGKAGRAKLIIN